jgi:hypothetical protein
MVHADFYPPAPRTSAPQEPAESDLLVLRDGSAAQVRLARPEDREALRAFFERLSPSSRWHRFFPYRFRA